MERLPQKKKGKEKKVKERKRKEIARKCDEIIGVSVEWDV